MTQLGRIEQWNDDKGYGFVRPLESQAADGNSQRAFVHIKSIEYAGRRPGNGDLIRYDTQRDQKGRLNAVNVSFLNAAAMRAQTQARNEAKISARERHAYRKQMNHVHRAIIAIVAISLLGGWWLKLWPGAISLLYMAMSGITFFFYRQDKNAAENGRQRMPENTLHALDLLCGWPGGLLAQQVFRHKTSKDSFQTWFWITVLLNCAVFFLLVIVDRIEHWKQMLQTP